MKGMVKGAATHPRSEADGGQPLLLDLDFLQTQLPASIQEQAFMRRGRPTDSKLKPVLAPIANLTLRFAIGTSRSRSGPRFAIEPYRELCRIMWVYLPLPNNVSRVFLFFSLFSTRHSRYRRRLNEAEAMRERFAVGGDVTWRC